MDSLESAALFLRTVQSGGVRQSIVAREHETTVSPPGERLFVDRTRSDVRHPFGGELATPPKRKRWNPDVPTFVDRARIELATHGFSGRCSTD